MSHLPLHPASLPTPNGSCNGCAKVDPPARAPCSAALPPTDLHTLRARRANAPAPDSDPSTDPELPDTAPPDSALPVSRSQISDSRSSASQVQPVHQVHQVHQVHPDATPAPGPADDPIDDADQEIFYPDKITDPATPENEAQLLEEYYRGQSDIFLLARMCNMTIPQVLAWRNKPETRQLLAEMDAFAHQRARDILTQALPTAASALRYAATATPSRPTNAESLAEDTRRKAATRIITFVTGQHPKPCHRGRPTSTPPEKPTPPSRPSGPGAPTHKTSAPPTRNPRHLASNTPEEPNTLEDLTTALQTLNIAPPPLPAHRADLTDLKPEIPDTPAPRGAGLNPAGSAPPQLGNQNLPADLNALQAEITALKAELTTLRATLQALITHLAAASPAPRQTPPRPDRLASANCRESVAPSSTAPAATSPNTRVSRPSVQHLAPQPASEPRPGPLASRPP